MRCYHAVDLPNCFSCSVSWDLSAKLGSPMGFVGTYVEHHGEVQLPDLDSETRVALSVTQFVQRVQHFWGIL